MLVGNVPFSIWGEDEKHKIVITILFRFKNKSNFLFINKSQMLQRISFFVCWRKILIIERVLKNYKHIRFFQNLVLWMHFDKIIFKILILSISQSRIISSYKIEDDFNSSNCSNSSYFSTLSFNNYFLKISFILH